MLALETRQIKILNILLQQEYTSLEQLISISALSQNTILSEIHQINNILNHSPYHLQIVNQRGKGYILKYPKVEKNFIDQLKKHCFFYLNIPKHSSSISYERIVWLLRHLLYARRNIEAEELAQKANISLTTLNKDLRVVRKIFEKYHITIESTPYYGMHLKGKELALRSCFLDYCDLYMIYEENIFPQYFMEQFEFKYEQFKQIFDQVKEVIIQKKIMMNDTGLRRLALYVLVSPLLRRNRQEDDLNDSLITTSHNPLISVLEKNDPSMDSCEKNLFVLFYLSQLEGIDKESLNLLVQCIPESQKIYENGLTHIERMSGLQIHDFSQMKEVIKKTVFKIVLRQKYGLCHFATPNYIKQKSRKEIASYSFSVYIIFALCSDDKYIFKDVLFYELLGDIHQVVYKLRNEYNACHALIVSRLGNSFLDVAMERLKWTIRNVDFSVCNEYELALVDYSHYDFVIVYDAVEINLSSIPIPVYEEDTKRVNNSSMKIWSNHVVKKRKVKVLRPYLDNPVFSTVLNGGDILDVIMNTFVNKGYKLPMSIPDFKQLLKELIFDDLYGQSPEIKIITLYTNQDIEYKYFAFNFEKPILCDGGKIGLLHFLFMDASNGPIIIKNGDSELRRYFNV